MTDDSRRLRPPAEEPESDRSDTREYETRVPRAESALADSRQSRGYWISAPPAGAQDAPAGRLGSAAIGAPPGTPSQEAGAPRKRARRSRGRRLVRLIVVAVILAGIVTAAALIITGRTVVPVISKTVYPINYRDDIARV